MASERDQSQHFFFTTFYKKMLFPNRSTLPNRSMPTPHKFKVRVECPQCAEGRIGHMTVDELLERSLFEGCDLSCPLCGLIHLSREEIEHLEKEKIIDSERYRQICLQALSSPEIEHQEQRQ